MKKSTISRAELIAELKAQKPERSAWGRGVQAAAVEIVEEVDALEELPTDYRELNSALLNGARDWRFDYQSDRHCAKTSRLHS